MKKLLLVALLIPAAISARTLKLTNETDIVLNARIKASLRGSAGVKEHGSLHAKDLKSGESMVLDFADTSRVRRQGPALDPHRSDKFAKVLDKDGNPVFDKLTDLFDFGTITKEAALKFKAKSIDKTVKGRLKLNKLSKTEQTKFAYASEVKIVRDGDKLNFVVVS